MRAVTVEVFADVTSPWCYVAKRRLEAALAILGDRVAADVGVRWLPFQRHPEATPGGLDRRAVRAARFGSPGRADAADALVTEAARCEGLALNLDRVVRLPNTFDAHRLIALAGREGVQDAVVEGLFHAYFTEALDLAARPNLLDAVASAGLDRGRAARLLDSTDGMAEVWAEESRARSIGVRVVPHVLISGAPAPGWPWDPWTLADAVRRVHQGLLILPAAPPEPGPAEGRYGFAHTRCGCDFCRVYCRHVPGRLGVGDLERLCPVGADPFAWAEGHLLAVIDTPYPKLVPRRQANGHCQWYAEGGCTVHDRAPYGCAYFDAHMGRDEVERRSRPVNHACLQDAETGGLYFRVWRHLRDRGLTSPSGDRAPVNEEMRLLRLSIEKG